MNSQPDNKLDRPATASGEGKMNATAEAGMMTNEDEENMESLFEGMELFTASRSDTGDIDSPQSSALDENLFSDLTVVETTTTTGACNTEIQPHTLSSSAQETKSISISRQTSKKKKIAAGLRIGYGRDAGMSSRSDYPQSDHQEPTSTFDNDAPLTSSSDDPSSQTPDCSDLQSEEVDLSSDIVDSEHGQTGFELIKAQTQEKLYYARGLVDSASAARRNSIRRRRKAVESVRLATDKYRELELQLEEACEAEDFERAESISESLAAAENEKQLLLQKLRDFEADCDATETKMVEALHFQLASEQDCALLFHKFAMDTEKNAGILLKNAEEMSFIQMNEWFSSTEALEGKKIGLEFESYLISEARSLLNDSIERSVEDDRREIEILSQKRQIQNDELQKLLALVKEKEKEIAENDSKMTAVEERILDVVSGFQEIQSSIDAKYAKLQSDLSQLNAESEALSTKKEKMDEFHSEEANKGEKLREVARFSACEAKSYEDLADLRKSLMISFLKSRDNKMTLYKTEERLSEDLEMLQQEVSAARASLQELSSMKSSIQQNISSFNQKTLFVGKRVPELETEKKVAATARNFKEAARIAAEIKSMSMEKENTQIDIDKATAELEKIEGVIKNTLSSLEEIDGLILSKENDLAKARFQRLLIIARAARTESCASLELGDSEEANLLLAEAEEAELEAKKLEPAYHPEESINPPICLVSMELISNLSKDELTELAAAVCTTD